VLGTLFQIVWSVAGGMSLGLALAYNAFFWILFVTMTRIYAQVGPPILELYYLDPQKTLTTVFGTLGQSQGSLTQFSLMYWINRDHRGQPMAHQLSAFYVGKATGVNARSLGRWVLVAFMVGSVTCLLTYLHWAYKLGEDTWVSGGWREAGSGTGGRARPGMGVHAQGATVDRDRLHGDRGGPDARAGEGELTSSSARRSTRSATRSPSASRSNTTGPRSPASGCSKPCYCATGASACTCASSPLFLGLTLGGPRRPRLLGFPRLALRVVPVAPRDLLEGHSPAFLPGFGQSMRNSEARGRIRDCPACLPYPQI
jgi:hypothetical protein